MNHTRHARSTQRRALFWIGCCLLSGCATSPTSTPQARTADAEVHEHDPAAVTPNAATADVTTSAAAQPATPSAAPPPDHDVVADDVALMAGGNFAPDHIGPAKFDAVTARFEAAPLVYLAEVRAQLEPITHRQRLSFSMHVDLIAQVAEKHPGEAAEVARAVLPKYRNALAEAKRMPTRESEVEQFTFWVSKLERIAKAARP